MEFEIFLRFLKKNLLLIRLRKSLKRYEKENIALTDFLLS